MFSDRIPTPNTRRSFLESVAVLTAWLATPNFASAKTPAIRRYDEINTLLSTPAPQPYSSPYFHSNERDVEKFYARLENIGGVMVGIGSQQNFTFLVHGRPNLYVIFDINPDVTEILVPFHGQLIAGSPTRQAFLSRLTGVTFNPQDVEHLLAPHRQPRQPVAELGNYISGVIGEIFQRVPKEDRKRSFEAQMAKTLSRLPVTQHHRAEVMKWFDYLEEEMLNSAFFQQWAQAAWIAGDDRDLRNRLASWMSTEENYRVVRRYWVEGRIIGVTGDIGGPSVAKLAAWLRGRSVQGKPSPVTFIYLANVGASVTGHAEPAYFSKLYSTLGQLPLSPQALTLISQGTRVAYMRSYERALAHYNFLSSVGTDALILLVEYPLSYMTLTGVDDAIRKLKEGLSTLVQNRRSRGIQTPDPSNYLALLDRLPTAREELRALSSHGFEDWAKSKWPAMETQNDIFRALTATLVELGILRGA